MPYNGKPEGERLHKNNAMEDLLEKEVSHCAMIVFLLSSRKVSGKEFSMKKFSSIDSEIWLEISFKLWW